MENQAPSQVRNLAPHVAAWLRRLGFIAREAEQADVVAVAAHWQAPDGKVFYVDYEYTRLPQPAAVLRMTVYHAGVVERHLLIAGQHVRRLKEARQLVLNDQVFAAARRLLSASAATT